MSGDGWDELLQEARAKLAEQDEVNSDLGDDMSPAAGQHFAGRWRGVGRMQTNDRGEVDVYLVWRHDDDAPGFLYAHARLRQEVDAERPEVGDEVLVLRGEDEQFEKGGETRTVFPYVLRKRPSSLPPPAQPAAPIEPPAGGTSDDDIPFMPTL